MFFFHSGDIVIQCMYSIWWICKKFKVYFMIIYCYDINSLSCLTRFIHDPPHTFCPVVNLIEYINIFIKAQCFTGILSRGQCLSFLAIILTSCGKPPPFSFTLPNVAFASTLTEGVPTSQTTGNIPLTFA